MFVIFQLALFITQVSRIPFNSKEQEYIMDKEEKIQLGNKHLENKDYTNALNEYTDVIKYIENQLSIDFYDLDNVFEKKDTDSIKTQLADLLFKSALIRMKQRDYIKAISNLKRLIEMGKLSYAKNKLAICYFKIGEFYKGMEIAICIEDKEEELEEIVLSTEFNDFTCKFGLFDLPDIIIDAEFCSDVLQTFLENKRIDGEQLIKILFLGYLLHSNIANVQTVTTDHAVVFGDTHGQFLDTFNILNEMGNVLGADRFYLNDKIYIFNGDFVDRGCDGIENFVLLIMLKIVYPQRIFINKGNHEFEHTNRYFGFHKEIKGKYGNYEEIFNAFQIAFSALPLATVLNDKYFIVHGGLPQQKLTLEEIQSVNRFRNNNDSSIIDGMMWSDPDEIPDVGISQRGNGIRFGYSITNSFLKINKLEKIIRSHEFCVGGVKYNHDDKVITIFSAPNYCDIEGDAAVLYIEKGEIGVKKVKHWMRYEKFRNYIFNIRNL